MQTKLLAAVLAFLLPFAAFGQAGPDNDPAAAPGLANNVFHTPGIDSINQFNGQLTIPIPIGPSYPVGPSLSFQAILTYNSRVTDPGQPGPGAPQPPPTQDFSRVVVGNPALGIGWNFNVGRIGRCIAEASFPPLSPCYFRPDGGQVQFGPGSGDSNQFKLQRTGTSPYVYTMWDGDGNKYLFDKQVTGYDDVPLNGNGYIRDYGLGRDGWYLTSITDPFNNQLQVQYYGPGFNPCPFTCASITSMSCGNDTSASWIPRYILTKAAGSSIAVTVGEIVTDPAERIVDFKFKVVQGSASVDGTWHLTYGTVLLDGRPSYCNTTLQTITGITLPSDVTGTSGYEFAYFTTLGGYKGLLKTMTLPTGAAIRYDYGNYHFYRGRTAELGEGCNPQPPRASDVTIRSQPFTEGEGRPDPDEDGSIQVPSEPCLPTRQSQQSQKGVQKRTVTGAGVPADQVTDYTQYSFPFGEQGDRDLAGTLSNPQTLTVVLYPPDVNARRHAETTLFWAGPEDPTEPPVTGDQTGADIRRAAYDHDPNSTSQVYRFDTPVCSSVENQGLCATNAMRVTQNIFEYGIASTVGTRRRVKSATTYYGHITTTDPRVADFCPSCKRHKVEYLLRPANNGEAAITWEGNGRHYNIERHTGTLGNDSREITTYWTPNDASWLRNLFDRRYETFGTSSVKRYFYFNAATGFLNGTLTWEPTRMYFSCRYPTISAVSGLVANEVTLRDTASPLPPEPPTPLPNPCLPAVADFSTIGDSDDLFAKQFSYSGASILSAKWMQTPSAAAVWPIEQYTRDSKTGWALSSTDTAGQTTSYQYDSLNRVTKISPPGEAATYVCYDNLRKTVAARSATPLTCPIERTDTGVLTWQQLDFDGLGRQIRETRRMPASAYSKRFTLYDAREHPFFTSEWVSETTPTSVTEPTGDFSSYRYDVNGKLSCVKQRGTGHAATSCLSNPSGQAREFLHDSMGFLRSENTPEKGAVTYDDYGSLGNLLQRTEPGGVTVAYHYDYAEFLRWDGGARRRRDREEREADAPG